MLTIPLFRGFGFLVVCVPTYRKPKKPRPRPLLNCPKINGDLFKDARTLLASDNPIAAAMIARVEIERLLTTLAMERPDFGPYWIGAKPTATWLRKRRVIKLRTCEAVLAALDTGNGAAHGEQVSKDDVGKMFNAINSLRGIVHLKGGAKVKTKAKRSLNSSGVQGEVTTVVTSEKGAAAENQTPNPTSEELAAFCAEFQSRWSTSEERFRSHAPLRVTPQERRTVDYCEG